MIYEPSVIGEYLDERYPHPAMLPNEPGARAQARVVLHRIERDWYGCAEVLHSGEGRELNKARRRLLESVLAVEPLFRIKAWFLSDQFSLLDAAVAPILWRLPHWRIEMPAGAESIQQDLEAVLDGADRESAAGHLFRILERHSAIDGLQLAFPGDRERFFHADLPA